MQQQQQIEVPTFVPGGFFAKRLEEPEDRYTLRFTRYLRYNTMPTGEKKNMEWIKILQQHEAYVKAAQRLDKAATAEEKKRIKQQEQQQRRAAVENALSRPAEISVPPTTRMVSYTTTPPTNSETANGGGASTSSPQPKRRGRPPKNLVIVPTDSRPSDSMMGGGASTSSLSSVDHDPLCTMGTVHPLSPKKKRGRPKKVSIVPIPETASDSMTSSVPISETDSDSMMGGGGAGASTSIPQSKKRGRPPKNVLDELPIQK